MQLEQKLMELSHNLNPEVVKLIASEIQEVMTFCYWAFGICAGGISFLLWLIITGPNKLRKKVNEIDDDLRGTIHEKGLATRVYDNQKDIERIKKKLNINGSSTQTIE